MNIVKHVAKYNAGREPERLALKYSKMRASSFAFLRGSCHLFYERLADGPRLPASPLVWVCGDLHLENFGSYKGDNRQVYFDINDFDEAALAPASWDLLRMLASMDVGLTEAGLKKVQVIALCQTFCTSYASALAAGKSYWLERDIAQGPVRHLLDGLRQRKRAQFLGARTERQGDKRRIRIDGIKALAATAPQRHWVRALISNFATLQSNKSFYRVHDVARRIAGTGSLGLERYIVLIEGKGGPDGHYLLDLKLAVPSSLSVHMPTRQPQWVNEAARVVAMQQRIQAVPIAFLHAIQTQNASYVLRGLQPSEDRITIATAKLKQSELGYLMDSMGKLVAWANLRCASREGAAGTDALMAFGQRKKWQIKLLDATRECAQQVRKDAATFNAAFDDKAFNSR